MRRLIIELQPNPHGKGFIGWESKDGGCVFFENRVLGAQTREFWRMYRKMANGFILRERS